MKKLIRSTSFRILAILALFISFPFILWQLQPSHAKHIWILDKTVPTTDYREHKGLMWLLNHHKIRNSQTDKAFQYDKDYYGFFPKKGESFETNELPLSSEHRPELIYIADTYGVFEADYFKEQKAVEGSTLLYGGLDEQDIIAVTNQLHSGATLITEFNTLASPTKTTVRQQLEDVLGVEWQGWMGRYFVDLTKGKEVSSHITAQYELQNGQPWNHNGPGLLLVSKDNQVIVLEQGKDIGDNLLSYAYEPAFEEEFGSSLSLPYYYWFDITQPSKGTEVIASFKLDTSESGSKKLQAAGLTAEFPAVLRKKTSDYTGYYLAGDFADNNSVPSRWNIWGVDKFLAWFTRNVPGEPDAFYWKMYVPMMKHITDSIQPHAVPPLKEITAKQRVQVHEDAGLKQISKVVDGHLAVFDGVKWQPRFWNGMNLGATTPGHFPGELSPSKEDYLRWFPLMKQMNINVIRIYTILPPSFYEALDEFNRNREYDPLLLLQGVWTPEEELIGLDQKGNDAYSTEITDTFSQEIINAVKVIHGDAALPLRKGHAGGEYKTDVSGWLLGWIIGTEWFPYAVQVTNDKHRGMPPFQGKYFQADADASPFENWLTSMLEIAAREEMKYGWQHPISFTNWLTTDPLSHPNEPLEQEDLVSVDPMHISPTTEWKSGYFAAYHVYPYYPDFLRFEQKYLAYRDAKGEINPYAGYLHDLRQHHKDIPLIVAEFGVPSSRGMAHYGPAGRNQGMHTEKEQGQINRDMIEAMYNEHYDGSLLFAWQDEWFKFTWNTIDLELPWDRRALWRNRLTNEENFGVIAVEPGATARDMIVLDGKTEDWQRKQAKTSQSYEHFELTAAHDEAYFYLLLKKNNGDWMLDDEPINIGFDTLSGGSITAKQAPGINFDRGIEFLLQLRGEKDISQLLVNSAYDQHTWLYTSAKSMLPGDPTYSQAELGIFLPWKLALNKALYLPQTKVTMPFEELEVGIMHKGRTDVNADDFNSLADWYAEGSVLEIRIPWMMLGYTDPSSKLVWEYPYQANEFKPVPSEGIRVEPFVGAAASSLQQGTPLMYTWENWDEPVYHERKKQSFDILRQAYMEFLIPKPKP